MKTLLAFAFSAALFAQVNFTVTGQITTGEFNSLESWRVSQFAPGQPVITLNGAITAGATSITVSAVPVGWTQGLAAARPATCARVDPSVFSLNLYWATDTVVQSTCVATNAFGTFASQIVIDSEAMTVTAFNGLALTVTRGQGGTTAAAHASVTTVNILKYPNAILLAKQFIRDGLGNLLVSANAAQIQTLQATITNDQAAIVALQTGAVR